MSYLEAIERRKVAEAYRADHAQRSARDAKTERDLLDEWQLSDAEAWAILEDEEKRDRPMR